MYLEVGIKEEDFHGLPKGCFSSDGIFNGIPRGWFQRRGFVMDYKEVGLKEEDFNGLSCG